MRPVGRPGVLVSDIGSPFNTRRLLRPAIEASGLRRPARICDLRATVASNAIAAGIGVFVLARAVGTSVAMVEHHYGTLLDGATADIAGRLDALDDAQQDRAVDDAEGV